MALLVATVFASGAQNTHKRLLSKKTTKGFIPKLSLFGVHCILKEVDGVFFKNEAGNAGTVNGGRYYNIIAQFFIPQL